MTKPTTDLLDERDGQEPLEEVAANECEADPKLTEEKPGSREGQPHESQHKPMDELSEGYVPQAIRVGISPEDGLPIPLDESPNLALAPAFSIENVLCLEDARSYVEVFAEDLRDEEGKSLARLMGPRREEQQRRNNAHGRWLFVAVVGAGLVAWAGFFAAAVAGLVAFLVAQSSHRARQANTTSSYGTRSKWKGGGGPREPLTFRPDEVRTRFGQRLAKVPSHTVGLEGVEFVLVRPVREQCDFYKRQLFANDDQPDPNSPGHRIVFRNCTKRRSVGGAFMSIRDEAVYACDYRSPASAASGRMLDELDQKILEKSRTRQLVPLFNLTAKLPTKKKETRDE